MFMKKRIIIFSKWIVILVGCSILILKILFMIFEERLIFFPSKYPEGFYEDARTIPNMKDCWITTEDGVKLHGVFASVDNPLATLVISHGNAGNITHRFEMMKRLMRAGFNVLFYDYRGYGKSEGSPGEEGVYKDGRAAFDFALTLQGVDPHRIVLWGTSLGGAVAVDVAFHRPAAAALILESTFTSAKDVVREVYHFLPASLLLHSQFNSMEKIPDISIPVFCMHGNRDSVIPYKLGRQLYEAARQPKQFYEIAGADHNDTYLVGGNEYMLQIRDFIIKSLGPKNGPVKK